MRLTKPNKACETLNDPALVVTSITRRNATAGLVSTVSCPAIVGLRLQPDFDVLIVGAGAAGIAAARRVAASRRTVAVLEASDRWGGRCLTDTSTFNLPYDQGAYAIHLPEQSSLPKLAAQNGIELYPDPERQQIRLFGRKGFVGDLEDLYANRVRCNRAILNAASAKDEISCEKALPEDLDDNWRRTMEFILGPYRFGADLKDLSAKEYAVTINRNPPLLCRQGVGFLIGRLAGGLPIKFFSPVTLVDWGDRSVALETSGGVFTARAVIVTASTAVLASGKVKFKPNLPAPYLRAIEKLKLGSYDHVAIEFNGNPLGLEPDQIVFEKVTSDFTPAALIANLHGSRLSLLLMPGKSGAELAEKGESAMNDFALDWISTVFRSSIKFGTNIKKAVLRTHTTSWNKQPWALGAFSSPYPGTLEARKLISEPLNDLVWFAGEAAHQTHWGTVGGAWQDGERAADAILARLDKR